MPRTAGGMLTKPNLLATAEGVGGLELPRHSVVDITSDLIEKSERADSGHCMIAEAIKSQIPGASCVSVDLQGIRYSLPKIGVRVMHLTPGKAQSALLDFDEEQHVKPFKFRLGPPAWVSKMGNGKRDRTDGRVKKQGKKKNKKRSLVVTANAGAVIVGDRLPRRGRRRAFGLKGYRGARVVASSVAP